MNAAIRKPLTVNELLAGLAAPVAAGNTPVSGLASDSVRVRPGDLFLALPGLRHHGASFARQAVARGACAVAYQPPAADLPADLGVPAVPVPELSRHAGTIASRLYGAPERSLGLIGVTGTDGKTSCTQFIAQALALRGDTCGIMGTLGYGLPGALEPSTHTTADTVTLWQQLATLRDRAARWVAMEVSSHALDQGRVAGLPFAIAVFTNLSRDHLDYHGDMARYGAAKRRLFTEFGAHTAVINLDDAFGAALAAELAPGMRVIGYGFGAAPHGWRDEWLGVERLIATPAGLDLSIVGDTGCGRMQSPLLGRFNALNLLAVLGVLAALDVSLPEAMVVAAGLTTVPGRMERFGGDGQPLVVVDYAHTPNALEQCLAAVREHASGRLWCVFGCGGDRDPGKRPQMGAVAERHADRVIITNDNPRSEDPDAIARQVMAGMDWPDEARLILDRRAAIRTALAEAGPGDVVLVAGKGHENLQIIGDRRLPFDDREVVRSGLGPRS